MRVHIGTDHAAFELKQFLVQALTEHGYDVVDHGAREYDSEDDYPVWIIPTAEAVAASDGDLRAFLLARECCERLARAERRIEQAIKARDEAALLCADSVAALNPQARDLLDSQRKAHR